MVEGQKMHGICAVCGYRTDKAGMTRHLAKPHAQGGAVGQPVPQYHLRVEGADGLYWLDVEANANARLLTSISFSGESGWSAAAI